MNKSYSFFSNKLVWLLLLLCLNLGVIFAHKHGVFNKSLDLLAKTNHTDIYPHVSENVTQSFSISNQGKPQLECNMVEVANLNLCTMTILLAKNGEFDYFPNSADLSNYDNIHINISYQYENRSNSLSVSFRTYHPDYSIKNDYTSLKYNSAVIQSSYDGVNQQIPFNLFNVEDWWLEEKKIDSYHSGTDFSNVAFIEIMPHEMTQPGQYRIAIDRFELLGEYISETSILRYSLLFWLIVIFSFILVNNNQLRKQATTDMVTGFLNRRGLSDWVNTLTNSNEQSSNICMFYIDLDDFKKVNDKHGHNIGDLFLKFICAELNNAVKTFNPNFKYRFARLSGDELAIVINNMNSDDTEKLARFLLAVCNKPMITTEVNLKVSASIGVSLLKDKATNFEELLNLADMAMYKAKDSGKNNFRVFDQELLAQFKHKTDILDRIRCALKKQEFELVFMPIHNISTNQMVRAEVLLRGGEGSLKGIGPDVFIPLAEEYKLINDIDMWVLEQTFNFIKTHQQTIELTAIMFCINISAMELQSDTFVENLDNLLQKYDVDPSLIEIEITETCLVNVDKKSIDTMEKIKNLGIKLALDDFGTGYTAFNQLVHYPVNCLKIDRSFVSNLNTRKKETLSLVRAIIGIAHSLDLGTIAEGIETEEQLHILRDMKCEMAQGYWFSKPIKGEELFNQSIKLSSNKQRIAAVKL